MSTTAPSHRLGVCSWSLRSATPEQLADDVHAAGLAAVQLALGPLLEGAWEVERTVAALSARGVTLLSGMVAMHGEDYASLESIRRTGGLRPDAHWERNRALAAAAAPLARRLGLELVTFHAGFLPEAADDPERPVLLARLREVVGLFAAEGVAVGLETGQETTATLLGVLEELDLPTLGVNFDPANLLLYGTDEPLSALARLAPWVRQCHLKDALRSEDPGRWGREVPVGRGEVSWEGFARGLGALARPVDLVVEREAGPSRIADVAAAVAHVRPLLEAS